MADEEIKVVLKGNEYIWDGEQWYDEQNMHIPDELKLQLNRKLEPKLLMQPVQFLSSKELLWKGMAARDSKMFQYAEHCLRALIAREPNNSAAISVYSSINRQLGKSQEAIRVSESVPPELQVAVGVSRAAALADECRYEEALVLIRKVLATSQCDAAFRVYKRIEKEAPRLVAASRLRR